MVNLGVHDIAFLLVLWYRECTFLVAWRCSAVSMKLLVVDDEQQIRESMTRYIASLGWDFESILTADNGLEALYLVETYRPDILVVDVLMPGIDGIETIERALEYLPELQIIIISGCNDFQYVKSALRFPVEDYVLKPIHLPELNAALQRVVSKVDAARSRTQSYERTLWFEQGIPDMQERFLAALLHGRYADDTYVETTTKTLSLDSLLCNPLLISVITLRAGHTDTESSAMDFSSLRQVLPSYLDESDRMIWADDMLIAVLSTGGALPQPGQLSTRLEDALAKMEHVEAIHAVAGIGTPVFSPLEMADSYRLACDAVQIADWSHIRVMTSGDLLSHQDADGRRARAKSDAVWAIKSCLVNGDTPLLHDCVGRLIASLIHEGTDKEKLWYAKLELARVYVKLLQNLDANLLSHPLANLSQMEHLASDTQLADWFEAKLAQLGSSAIEQRKSRAEFVAQWMKQQIHERYQQQLSLQLFADESNLSASYLSQVFSEQIGATFLQYLTDCRMNNAIEKLGDARIPISHIGAMVGYESGNYFARLFRKRYGMSPSEYRERMLI